MSQGEVTGVNTFSNRPIIAKNILINIYCVVVPSPSF